MNLERTYYHKRTKSYAFIRVESDTINTPKIQRWIEIQLNKHGWYQK